MFLFSLLSCVVPTAKDHARAVWDCEQVWTGDSLVWWGLGGTGCLLELHWLSGLALQQQVGWSLVCALRVCVCVFGVGGGGVQEYEIVYVYIYYFAVLCIHFDWSCNAQCAHLSCQQGTIVIEMTNIMIIVINHLWSPLCWKIIHYTRQPEPVRRAMILNMYTVFHTLLL